MSVDRLQEKIRKLKNPSMIAMNPTMDMIPSSLVLEEGTELGAYARFCKEILIALNGIVPAVRFSYGCYSLMGGEGLQLLQELLQIAKDLGFYVLVDVIQALSPDEAVRAANYFAEYPCDGFVVSSYIGSDGLKPYVKVIKDKKKGLYVVMRTANRTASELQDLMTGSRLVHMAMADVVSYLSEGFVGKCGYAQIAGTAAASSSGSIKSLRAKYRNIFLLIDGYDYSNANAKNCSYAFDKLGHGAVVCSESSVVAAWQEESAGNPAAFADYAVAAAERMKKNITRYTSVL